MVGFTLLLLAAPFTLGIDLPCGAEGYGPGPRIIGVADGDQQPILPSSEEPVAITTGAIAIQLANAEPAERFVAYVDGKPLPVAGGGGDCSVRLEIGGKFPPGIHTLVLRSIREIDGCPVASEPSAPVVFHYQEESRYIFRESLLPVAAQRAPMEDFESGTPAAPNGAPNNQLKRAPPALPPAPPTAPGDTHFSRGRRRTIPVSSSAQALRPTPDVQETNMDEFETLPVIGNNVEKFTFAAPAHFSFRGWGLRGEPYDAEGVIIYEGMTVSFDASGQYEVWFRANHPDRPATLRLQLQLQTRTGDWHTITLAPIAIGESPEASFRDSPTFRGGLNYRDALGRPVNEAELSQNIVRTGTSPALAKIAKDVVRMRRAGSARIGFGVSGYGGLTLYGASR